MASKLPSRDESVQKVKNVFARFDKLISDNDNLQFDADLMKHCTVVDASANGSLVVELKLGKQYANARGSLHGGAVGLILGLDQFTTFAYIPLPDFDEQSSSYRPPGGLSWSLQYTCLRPLALPALVRVISEVVYNGKKMCLIKGTIVSQDQATTYYVGEQHKVMASGQGAPPIAKI